MNIQFRVSRTYYFQNSKIEKFLNLILDNREYFTMDKMEIKDIVVDKVNNLTFYVAFKLTPVSPMIHEVNKFIEFKYVDYRQNDLVSLYVDEKFVECYNNDTYLNFAVFKNPDRYVSKLTKLLNKKLFDDKNLCKKTSTIF